MDEAQRKAFIRQTFDTVSVGYDREALRFFGDSAGHMAEQLQLKGDEHVLDVATGTGAVALTLARRLPGGRVTGIDLSTGMLGRAEAKAAELGLGNTSFQAMDMTCLNFPSDHFHGATAAFSLFFVVDMEACLRGIVRHLKPGGHVVACAFTEDAFIPHVDLFFERIQAYGVELPPMSWKRMCHEDANHELFAAAGLENVRTTRRDLSYPLGDAEAWWDVIWYAGFRGLVGQLAEEDLARFRAEHLAEIAALGDIPLRVEVIYAVGSKPV